jgi:hypothetical protein
MLAGPASIAIVVAVWLNLFYRLLFGTLLGVFLVSIVCYVLVSTLTTIEPYGLTGLLDWFTTLPRDTQAAVGTVLLSVIGFIAAIWVAFALWKRQFEMQIRMSAADHLNDRFNDASELTNKLGSLFDALQESVADALTAPSDEQAKLELLWVNSQQQRVFELQLELGEARANYYKVIGAYAHVLASVSGGWAHYERGGSLIAEAHEACGIYWPRADISSPNFVRDFLAQINKQEINKARIACERITTDAAPLIGGLRGRLTKGSVTSSFAAAQHISKHRQFFAYVWLRQFFGK